MKGDPGALLASTSMLEVKIEVKVVLSLQALHPFCNFEDTFWQSSFGNVHVFYVFIHVSPVNYDDGFGTNDDSPSSLSAIFWKFRLERILGGVS